MIGSILQQPDGPGTLRGINGDYGTTEFRKNYDEIHAKFEVQKDGPAGAISGSIRAAIISYKNSPEYKNEIEVSTKRDYIRYLNLLEAKFGDMPVPAMKRSHVKNIRNKFSDAAHSQLHRAGPQHHHGACDRRGYPGNEPGAQDQAPEGRRRPPGLGGEGDRPVPGALASRKLRENGVRARAKYRGQYLVKMQRDHIDSGVISVAQLKTGERVSVPISNDLRVALDAWDAHQDTWVKKRESAAKPRPVPIDVKLMILTGDRGRRLTPSGFQHKMIDSSKLVPDLPRGLADGGTTTHGLRYAATTRLYELGVSFDGIASITGHETATMVKKYAKKRRQAQLAIASLNAATEAQKKN